MPQVSRNEDGSRTLTITSTEVRHALENRIPRFGTAVRVLKEPDARAVLDFLRAVVS
jgi:hypothetical protein